MNLFLYLFIYLQISLLSLSRLNDTDESQPFWNLRDRWFSQGSWDDRRIDEIDKMKENEIDWEWCPDVEQGSFIIQLKRLTYDVIRGI